MPRLTRRTTLALLSAAPLAALSGTARAASHAMTHEVTIEGFAFAPDDLTVGVGDTVVFTNRDGAPHTASAEDGSFDTGRLNRGDSASVTFDSAGAFDYICQFHRSMKGKITVS